MKPSLVQLHLDSLPTDELPDTIWTRDTQGDYDTILEWHRIGGGWRTTYPDGSHSYAHSTRELRIYRPWLVTDPRTV